MSHDWQSLYVARVFPCAFDHRSTPTGFNSWRMSGGLWLQAPLDPGLKIGNWDQWLLPSEFVCLTHSVPHFLSEPSLAFISASHFLTIAEVQIPGLVLTGPGWCGWDLRLLWASCPVSRPAPVVLGIRARDAVVPGEWVECCHPGVCWMAGTLRTHCIWTDCSLLTIQGSVPSTSAPGSETPFCSETRCLWGYPASFFTYHFWTH